jgi:5-carboxyvanillate decarboxylase
MDACGIDMQVLALTSPGAQVMDTATAVDFVRRRQRPAGRCDPPPSHPLRRDGRRRSPGPGRRREGNRARRDAARLHAVVINSHTQGQYLSDPKFWDIFAAAEAHDAPIYLHPNSLPAGMYQPFFEAGLDGAIYGFGVETGLHALRIITAGVFDRFPKLRMVLGHMGEALPFWAYRLDYMHRATVRSQRYDSMKPIQRQPSEYLREHFYITNSGVAWEPAIRFTQEFMGMDRVLYAMDYPYQHAVDEVAFCDAMTIPDADKKKPSSKAMRERVFKLTPEGRPRYCKETDMSKHVCVREIPRPDASESRRRWPTYGVATVHEAQARTGLLAPLHAADLRRQVDRRALR